MRRVLENEYPWRGQKEPLKVFPKYVFKVATLKFSVKNLEQYLRRSTFFGKVAGSKALTLLMVLCSATRFCYFFKRKTNFFPGHPLFQLKGLTFTCHLLAELL